MGETETVLLRRFTGNGDAQALAELVRRHAGLVYGAALRIVADVDRASDIAQETFLQLTKDAGSVTGSLPGWLHRVATHKAIDAQRRDTARRLREREHEVRRQPREAAEWKEISPHVDAALRELDPELREVLILHFLEGRTTREIAAARNTSQATVSRRIGAGVEQLRTKLRRRGILVAVGALSVLLGDNAVQAAPLPLLTELGKIALVGGAAIGTAGAGSGSGFHTITTGISEAVKSKAVAVAAVALMGAGTAVTYHLLTRSSPGTPVLAPTGLVVASPGHVGSGPSAEGRSRPGLPDNLPQVQTRQDQPPPTAGRSIVAPAGETPAAGGPIRGLASNEAESVPRRTSGYAGLAGTVDGFVRLPLDSQGVAPPPGSPYEPNRPADPNYRDPNHFTGT